MKNTNSENSSNHANDNSIDANELQRLILEGKECFNVKIEKAIIVIGNTGSGKSTLINGLIGNKMTGYISEANNSAIKLAEGEKGPEIGNSLIAKTTLPKYWLDKSMKTVYFDCPGFKDNRGPEQDIVNAVLVKHLFTTVNHVKIVIVAPEVQFDLDNDRAIPVLELISQIDEMFPNINEINDLSICLIVTKAKSKLNTMEELIQPSAEYIHNNLRLIKNEHEKNDKTPYFKNENSGFTKIFNTLLMQDEKQRPEKIEIFKSPLLKNKVEEVEVKIPASIFTMIGEMPYIKVSKVKPPISKLSKEKMNYACNELIKKAEGLINEIYVNIIDLLIPDVTKEINTRFREDLKEKLNISSENFENFVISLGSLVQDKTNIKLLQENHNSLSLLKTLLDSNTNVYIDSLESKLINSIELCRKFIATPITKREKNVIKFNSNIILSSEIYKEIENDIIKGEKKAISSTSLIFIMDQDLILPGWDLFVTSFKWKVKKDKKIDLSGDKKTNKHSGNFYGYAKNLDEKLTICLNGLDGESGMFNQDILTNKIKHLETEIDQIDFTLQQIKELKDLSDTKDSRINELKNNIQDKSVQIKKTNDKLSEKTALLDVIIHELDLDFLGRDDRLELENSRNRLISDQDNLSKELKKYEDEYENLIIEKRNIDNLRELKEIDNQYEQIIDKFEKLSKLKTEREIFIILEENYKNSENTNSDKIFRQNLDNHDIMVRDLEKELKELELIQNHEFIDFGTKVENITRKLSLIRHSIDQITNQKELKNKYEDKKKECENLMKELNITNFDQLNNSKENFDPVDVFQKKKLKVAGKKFMDEISSQELKYFFKQESKLEESKKYAESELKKMKIKFDKMKNGIEKFDSKQKEYLVLKNELRKYKQMFEEMYNELQSNQNHIDDTTLNKFREIVIEYKDKLNSKQEAEKEFLKLIAKKDTTINRSSETFKERINAKVINPSIDKDYFVENYKVEKDKLEEYLKKT